MLFLVNRFIVSKFNNYFAMLKWYEKSIGTAEDILIKTYVGMGGMGEGEFKVYT